METVETPEDLLAKQHRKEKKDLQGKRAHRSLQPNLL